MQVFSQEAERSSYLPQEAISDQLNAHCLHAASVLQYTQTLLKEIGTK